MNKTYRLIWHSVKETWLVVAETVKNKGSRPSCLVGSTALMLAVLSGALPVSALDPGALPSGGQIVAGQGSIATSGSAMTVNQGSQRMIANWSSFNIGQNASVNFVQPNPSAVALNRIQSQSPSQILGSLSANGQVWLINPSGIMFGQTARVDVGGLVASSLSISNENFMAGRSIFEKLSTAGSITNQGNIRTSNGGYLAFMAPKVSNEGTIITPGGTTALAAGNKVSLDFTGDQLYTFTVDQGAIEAQAANSGLIKADGGLVMMTANAAHELTGAVVNNSGVIEARTLENKSGRILLIADMEHGETIVSGRFDASAPDGGDGGFIETSAAKVTVKEDTKVTTVAPNGKTGLWLLDPTNFTISAGTAPLTTSGIGAFTLSTSLNTTNVTIQTAAEGSQPGDITVSSDVQKVSGSLTTLTLAADRNVIVNAPISGVSGSPLNVVLAARARGGTGGIVNVTRNIRTYGGDITIGGGDLQASGYAIANGYYPNNAGVFIGSTGSESSTSAILDATGNGSGGANALMPTASSGGNIVIRGSGSSTLTQSNLGVLISQAPGSVGSIITGGTGSIFIDGKGGNGQSFWSIGSSGILLGLNAYIKANEGNITLKGTAGTGSDRYGIAADGNKLIGTNNGYVNIEGDSLLIRNGTLTINAGKDSDIKAPIVGCTGGAGSSGCAAFGLTKTGTGILNLAGNAEAWNASPPSNTRNTPTNGIFTDLSVNVVSPVVANGALYAFSTRPATINQVEISSASPLKTDLTVTLLTSKEKLYGDTNPALATGTDYSIAGCSDCVNLGWGSAMTSSTGAGSYSYGNGGSAGTANLFGLSYLSGLPDNYYNVTWNYGSGLTMVVKPRPLTITTSKDYDGSPRFDSGFVLSGMVNGDAAPAVSGFADVSSPNAGTYTNFASSTLALANANYTLTGGSVSATINPSLLTIITGNLTGTINKVYDGTTTATLTPANYQLSGWVGDDNASVTKTTGSYDNANTGGGKTVTVSLTSGDYSPIGGTNLANYILPSSVSGAVGTITAAPLTVAATNATKTYDGLAYSGGNGVSYSGFVNGETAAVLGGTVAYGGSSQGAKNAGTYTITPFGLFSGNYQISYTDGTLNVNKKDATVTANSAMVTYNGLNQSVTGFSASGLVNGETTAVLTSVTTSGGSGKDTGSYAHTASGTDTNYNLSFVNGALTINPAALTVTATNASKTYDGLAYSGGNGVAYSGFVNGETATVLGGAVAYSGSSQGAKNAGSYIITPSGLTSGNYSISFADGTLTVNKKDATVTANSATVTYNGLNQFVTGFTASGLVNGETTAVLTSVTTSGGSGKDTGSYAHTASGTDTNYNLSFVNGALTINPAPLTVTATNATKTYDGLAYSGGNGVAYNGFVNNETAAVLGGTVAYEGSSQGAKNAGTYTITPFGLFSGNYQISYIDGALTVNKKDATVTANSSTVTYNGLNQSVTGFTASGLVNGETTAVLTGVTTSGGSGKDTGSYAHTASGTDTNYNLSFVNGALTINPAPLTVTANNASKTYDGLAYSGGNGVSYSGFVNGETAAVLGGTVAYEGSSQGAKNAGSYVITPSGLTSGNYSISFADGALTVNKKDATITANSATVTYNGLYQSIGFTVSGLVNGETAAVLTGVATSGGIGKDAGVYPHTASGADSNYNVRFVNGALTINKAPLTVTADNASKTIGSVNPALTVSYSGFVNSETQAVLTGSPSLTTTATTSSLPGTYPIIAAAGTLTAPNYSISFVNGVLTVNPSSYNSNPLFQNQLWWFGTPSPNPPPGGTVYTFTPLESFPGFSPTMFGWMKDLDYEACILGLSTAGGGPGPYGTIYNRSGC